MKTIYIDVMLNDRFVCQLKYEYCPAYNLNKDELREFVIQKRPTLRNKNFTIELSENKVI